MGIPGSPTTETLTSLEKTPLRGFADLEELDLARYLSGLTRNRRAALCVIKHNGFLAFQEMLNSLTNHDLRAPMIIVVGDEAGKTSQVAVDTRALCDSHELPLIQPSFEKIPAALAYSMTLSSVLRKPVIFRLSPDVAQSKRQVRSAPERVSYRIFDPSEDIKDYFATEGLALSRSAATRSLLKREAPRLPEASSLNTYSGHNNPYLVIASGGSLDRVRSLAQGLDNLDFLEVNTPSILDPNRIHPILQGYQRVLVVESWLPYLETKVRALVQQCGLTTVQVLGRMPTLGEPPFIVEGNVVLSENNLSLYLSALANNEAFVDESDILKVGDNPFLKVPSHSASVPSTKCHFEFPHTSNKTELVHFLNF